MSETHPQTVSRERRIDRLVAEHVMKWRISPVGTGPSDCYVGSEGELYVAWDDAWSPTEDISDAWDVVEKMNTDGWFCVLWQGATGWSIRFTGCEGFDAIEINDVKNPAEGICLAALAALGVEVTK